MAIGETPPFPRGKTRYDGDTITSTNLGGVTEEGKEYFFVDYDMSTSPPYKTRTDRIVKCRLVRNASGIALLPKRLVRYQKTAGNYKKRVDGYCAITAEDWAGVVDEWLTSAGVPNNDLFYIAISGPTNVLMPLAEAEFTGAVAIGDALVALTAATSQATTAGRVAEQDFSGSNVTGSALANQVMNMIGRALTARTTANTNTDMLVDLHYRF